MITFEEQKLLDMKKGKKKGLKGLSIKPETDTDRKKKVQLEKIEAKQAQGELIVENDADGKAIIQQEFKQQTSIDESNDGIDDGVLNMEK